MYQIDIEQNQEKSRLWITLQTTLLELVSNRTMTVGPQISECITSKGTLLYDNLEEKDNRVCLAILQSLHGLLSLNLFKKESFEKTYEDGCPSLKC